MSMERILIGTILILAIAVGLIIIPMVALEIRQRREDKRLFKEYMEKYNKEYS